MKEPSEFEFVELSSADWAYLAGLMEADGHIGLCPRTRDNAKPWAAQLHVNFTNNDPVLIEWVSSTFGGKVCHRPARSKTHQEYWQIQWYGSSVRPVIENIIPYLRGVKRSRAMLAVRFVEHIVPCGTRMGSAKKEARAAIIQEMRATYEKASR